MNPAIIASCRSVSDLENYIHFLRKNELDKFLKHAQIDDGGMMPIHKKYLEVLSQYDRAIWVKTLAVQLWVSEKTLEEDIEPLLLRLWKIEKTAQWRCLRDHRNTLFS